MVDGGVGTLLPRSAIPPGMPERRAAVTIARAGAAMIPRIVEEHKRRRARQNHAQTPRLHMARKVAKKVYKSY